MDKICSKVEEENSGNNLNSEEKKCGSPVFKCFNSTRPVRGSRLDSSEYDIPSYQVNQKRLDRTSVTSENDNSEPVFPFTPIFSPVPVLSQFQPPSIHSLGTVNKFVDKVSQSNCTNVENVKHGNVFESLGMTDKDISWVSSMASPPPKKVPGSELNTVEKKTLLPEEKFQSIQPRALFSPPTNDDSDCHPLTFTPENENDDDEEYKTNVRLSDVCATLKDLNVQSFDGLENLDATFTEDVEISPVIKAKIKKLNKTKLKKKKTLVLSPNKEKYSFSLDQTSKTKAKSNDGSNLIDDDSFQSMSFSCIDELCKSLMTDKSATDSDCDRTLVNSETTVQKKFYTTKEKTEVHAVSTIEDLHSYAKALEDGNQCLPQGKKVDVSLTKKGIVRFDNLIDNSKVEAVKRLHSDLSEKPECSEKRIKKMESDNSSWERAKEYLSESQLNVSDSEIFRTVENLEKTLASQKSLSIGSSQGVSGLSDISTASSPKVEDVNLKQVESSTSVFGKSNQEDILESPDNSKNEQTLINMDDNLQKMFWRNLIQWFSTSFKKSSFETKVKPLTSEPATEILGNELKEENRDKNRRHSANIEKVTEVSSEILEKTKISCCEMNDGSWRTRKDIEVSDYVKKSKQGSTKTVGSKETETQKQVDHPFVGFATASGNKVVISDEALEKARELMKSCDDSEIIQVETNNVISEGNSSTLKSSEGNSVVIDEVVNENRKNLKNESCAISTTAVASEDKKEKNINLTREKLKVCFTTASGKSVSVSEEALEKAQKLMEKCEVENLGEVKAETAEKKFSLGFSTASGNKIAISEEALEKAKKLMETCEEECKEEIVYNNGQKEREERKLKSCDATSNEALEEEKILIEEASVECSDVLNEETVQKITKDSRNFGFTTGLGTKITISNEALQKAKKLMEACEEDWGKTSEKLGKSWPYEMKENDKECAGEGPSTNSLKRTLKKGKTLKPSKVKPFIEFGNDAKSTKTFCDGPVGFKTASGSEIELTTEALEKAKSFFTACEQESCDELASIWMEELAAENREGQKGESSAFGFSTASGNKIVVSHEALEKAKKLMESCEESPESTWMKEINKNGDKELQSERIGFSTASGTKVPVSDEALKKAKVFMKTCEEEIYNGMRGEEINEEKAKDRKSKLADESNSSKVAACSRLTKSEEESFRKIRELKTEETKQKKTMVDDEVENEIPDWLHVYNTSPSMVSDRIELLPLVYHSENEPLKSFRGYVVKSPVIGPKDRFYGRKRKRKLEFEEEKEDGSCKRPLSSSIDFSAPFKRAKFVEEVDVKSERARARERLDKIIQEKEKVKPLKGLHYRKKCEEKQRSLMEAVGGCPPEVHPDNVLRELGVTEEVANVNVDNAASFKFVGVHFFGSECLLNTKGYTLADDCLLILDDDNQVGFKEIEKSFLASPGVQPNLIPLGWLENHFKWVVWKLSHYEKSFPRYFGGRTLTPENVLLQLKYRYDREIDRSERSALRKILERDDASCKRLVLCVSRIKQVVTGDMTGYELELTDGWYSCPARSDSAMKKLIEEKKICVGTKMITQGASLVNCEGGVSPLEMSKDVYLRISTNSTRRIRWDTKLGFQKNPENFPVSLRSILPQGGQITRIDVIIVRTYPVLYIEKTQDGHHVTRNRRTEERAEAEFRKIQEEKMERICNEVQQEMRKSKSKNEEEEMEALPDFQLNQSDRFNCELVQKVEEKLRKEKLKKRNVSECLKAKLVDLRKPDFNNPAVLSVWNPNEDLTSLLGEGKVFSLLNVTISNSTRVYKTLQINTTRQTQFRQIPKPVKYPSRKLTPLGGVSSKICPAFEEVDLVGLIASIQDVSYGSRLSQVVYLTDFQMNFVGVVFWGSRKDYGWETLLKVSSIVACSNLQWKKSYSIQEVPSLYVNENSIFTENPRQEHLKAEMEKLKQTKPENLTEFLSNAEEILCTKLENSKWQTNSSANDSSIQKKAKANGFESGPTASSTPIKPFQMRVEAEEAEPSPIQKRIEKLQCYGEPPSLIPLVVKNIAKKRKFKSNT